VWAETRGGNEKPTNQHEMHTDPPGKRCPNPPVPVVSTTVDCTKTEARPATSNRRAFLLATCFRRWLRWHCGSSGGAACQERHSRMVGSAVDAGQLDQVDTGASLSVLRGTGNGQAGDNDQRCEHNDSVALRPVRSSVAGERQQRGVAVAASHRADRSSLPSAQPPCLHTITAR
jgi:hypothetical protein